MTQSPTERLTLWMERRGLKQVDLARQMNVSEATISLILNGRRAPTDAFAGRFAKTFDAQDFVEVFGSSSPQAVPA